MWNKLLQLSCFLCISSAMFSQQETIKSSATSNILLLDTTFVISEINNHPHKIWIYLPESYEKSRKKYPIIYMHDGQNLFDAAISYAGEWEVDEALNKIAKNSGKEFIVVGIENAGNERINEYTPWKNDKYGGGMGALYIDFIIKELKPYIDINFRVFKNAKNTALIGSSLGGLISYYGGLKFPHVFGKIGALSTSFWFSEKSTDFTKEFAPEANIKLYMIVGEKESFSMHVDNKKAYELLLESGFNSKKLFFKIDPEGAHNEAFWKRSFPNVVNWLFNID